MREFAVECGRNGGLEKRMDEWNVGLKKRMDEWNGGLEKRVDEWNGDGINKSHLN